MLSRGTWVLCTLANVERRLTKIRRESSERNSAKICRETSQRSVRRDGRGSFGSLTFCDQPVGGTLFRYLCVSCSPCWSPMVFAFVGVRYSIPLLHLINRRSSRIPARANSHAGARRCRRFGQSV